MKLDDYSINTIINKPMNTKTLPTGDTKVWFDNEAEFKIINRTEPLIDTLIEASLVEKKFSRILVEEIKSAGFDEIHAVLLDVDDMLQTQLDNMELIELDMVFTEFNSIFHTNYKYHKSSNGLVSITLTHFDNYWEFVKDYFGSFILKLFACKIDLMRREEENHELQGLTEFISKFAPEYMKVFMKASHVMKFAWVINIVI